MTQAIYILKCLQDGMTEKEIIERFEDDQQIVEIWKSFLIHNRWIEHPDGKWEVTPKGAEWIQKVSNK